MPQLKFRLLLILFCATSAWAPASADTRLQVVTSFSILEDMVQQLGGDHVEVVNLVGRNSDAHLYRPVPSDSRAIQRADLVVFNGLAFEGWITRLIEDTEATLLVASDGVVPIVNDGETDPHAWQSFSNIKIYVSNITQALVELMPQHTDDLMHRQATYLDAIKGLETRLTNQLAKTPAQRRIVVTSHDAFGYLSREFDIRFIAPLGLSLEAEASAEDVAKVVDQIRDERVNALFLENINNPRLLKSISEETGVAIGGRLYSDALSEVDGPAGTYLDMMQHNLESLIDAFNSTRSTSSTSSCAAI